MVLFAVAALLFAAVMAADWFTGALVTKPLSAACVTVLPVGEDCEQLEAALRWAYDALQRGFDGYGTLYLVDAGASEEALAIAEAFCREHNGAAFADEENLRGILGDAVYKMTRNVLY